MRAPRAQVVGGTALFLLVVAAGTALRFYRLADLTVFLGDQAQEAQLTSTMIHSHTPALVGINPHLGGFHRGPAYLYLLLAPFWVMGGDPVSGAAVSAFLDSLAIIIIFLVGRSLFGYWGALAAAGFWAISPAALTFARMMWDPAPTPFFTLLIIYSLLRVARGHDRYLLLLVPAWAIAWQLHSQALLLLPMLALAWLWFRPSVRASSYVYAAALGAVTLLPFLYYELIHGFVDLRSMAQFASAAVLSHGGSGLRANVGRVSTIAQQLVGLIAGNQLVDYHTIFVLLAAVGVTALLWRAATGAKTLDARILLLWSLVLLLYAFWPEPLYSYYWLVLYPIPFLLLGMGISVLGRVPRAIQLSLIIGASLAFSIGTVTQFRQFATSLPGTYWTTAHVVDHIVNDARGQPFAWHMESAKRDESPYLYLFAQRHHTPSSRGDVPAFIVFDPAELDRGSPNGDLINGVKVVRFDPRALVAWAASADPYLLSSGELLDALGANPPLSPNVLPAPGTVSHYAGDARWALSAGSRLENPIFALEPAGEETNVTFTTRRFDAARIYLLAFEYNNADLHGWQRVYVTIQDSAGHGLHIYPTGAGLACNQTSGWETSTLAFAVPRNAFSLTIWLRAHGNGRAEFGRVELREVQR